MKEMPQHACEACNELIDEIRTLKHEFQRVKRLSAAELPLALNELQVRFGALEAQALEMKTFVCAAFVTHGTREPVDRIIPHTDRQMQAANDDTFALRT